MSSQWQVRLVARLVEHEGKFLIVGISMRHFLISQLALPTAPRPENLPPTHYCRICCPHVNLTNFDVYVMVSRVMAELLQYPADVANTVPSKQAVLELTTAPRQINVDKLISFSETVTSRNSQILSCSTCAKKISSLVGKITITS